MTLNLYQQYFIIGCFLVSVLAVITLYYISLRYKYWSSRAVYQTRKPYTYLLGHFADILFGHKSLPSLCYELYTETGTTSPLVGFYFLLKPALLVRNYDLMRDVLGIKSSSFNRAFVQPSPKMDPLMACSPLFALEDAWMTRVFDSRQKLERIFNELLTECNKLKRFVRNNLPPYQGGNQVLVDLDNIVDRYIRNIGMNIGIGMTERFTFGSALETDIANCISDALEPSFKQSLCLMIPGLANVLRVRMISPYHQKALIMLASTVLNEFYSAHEDNLLHWLNNLNVNREKQVRQLFAFYVELRVYLSGLARFLLCELAVHQDVQQKVKRELQQAIARNNGTCCLNLIQEDLPYLDRVINETLRLYPPVGCVARKCTEETELRYEDKSYWVRPGDVICVSVRGLHRDPKYWEQPGEFNPDRFDEGNNRRLFAPNEGLSSANDMVCRLALKMFIVTMIGVGRITAIIGESIPEVDPRSYVTVPLGKTSVLINRMR